MKGFCFCRCNEGPSSVNSEIAISEIGLGRPNQESPLKEGVDIP